MTYKELKGDIERLTEELKNTVEENKKAKIKKELAKLKDIEKHALTRRQQFYFIQLDK